MPEVYIIAAVRTPIGGTQPSWNVIRDLTRIAYHFKNLKALGLPEISFGSPQGIIRLTIPDLRECEMAESKKESDERKRRYFLPKETRGHLTAARAEAKASFESLFPPEFIEHRRAVRKELLLAARSAIDHVLSRLESA